MSDLAVGTGSWRVLDGNGRRVLVVDDNVDTAELFAELIGERGYVVETANDGPTALARSHAFTPEVVLLDLALPEIDGLEVARRLRAASPDLRLLAVTGFEHRRREVLAAGFDAYLVKPVAMSTIFDAIASPSRRGSTRPAR